MNARVVIVQELLPRYRVPFFEALRARLADDDVELVLVHGRAGGIRSMRNDEGELSWASMVQNRAVRVGSREIALWQPATSRVRDADLVIVEHANRHLLNSLLLANRPRRLAFWGHGGNLQAANPQSLSERVKRWTACKPDWWFAYTAGSADRVVDCGFRRDRITVVNNAIDSSEYDRIAVDRVPCRAVYVGGLDRTKRLPFLLEACGLVHERLPRFSLVIVGDGQLRVWVEEYAAVAPWLTYRGALFGDYKAREVAAAQLLLLPGLVGLTMLDSFYARTPLITLRSSPHSPEFEYLRPGVNGWVVEEDDTQAYAAVVSRLLSDDHSRCRLTEGCDEAAQRYSLSTMTANFAGGVMDALSL